VEIAAGLYWLVASTRGSTPAEIGVTSIKRDRPITIAMLALGGQGGGVLTNWLVALAEANGYLAQSTYVAGVAQRTGATVYCVEIFSKAATEAAGQLPIFTSYPIPGDVDLVVAAEMAEAGRAIEKGFVTPNSSTLIASSHRVYSMQEKEALGDGIIDMSPLVDVATKAAREFIYFDMQAAADATGSVISAVIFGAVAASRILPFEREAFEETIRKTGKAVDANLRGFSAGFDGVTAAPGALAPARLEVARPQGLNGKALAERIDANLPQPVRTIALHGALRALDYQDVAYAHDYLDLLGDAIGADFESKRFALSTEVARQLALQMCYEDVVRVADLKTRGERFDRIRQHVAATPGQPVHVVEYFHPRLEEICDTLPASIGAFFMTSATAVKLVAPFFRKGRNIRTSSITGFLLLHIMSKFKRFRRGSYRFARQSVFIREWLDNVVSLANADYDSALRVARAIEVVRGYGDTYERGLERYHRAVSEAGT
jgi:indolepyruvate ferredoxin oxidoreductase beta subunit